MGLDLDFCSSETQCPPLQRAGRVSSSQEAEQTSRHGLGPHAAHLHIIWSLPLPCLGSAIWDLWVMASLTHPGLPSSWACLPLSATSHYASGLPDSPRYGMSPRFPLCSSHNPPAFLAFAALPAFLLSLPQPPSHWLWLLWQVLAFAKCKGQGQGFAGTWTQWGRQNHDHKTLCALEPR